MTRSEVEILLKTVYKGEGATKALQDMDKISASGSKLSGAMKQVNKALGGSNIFAGASQSFIKANPHLFQPKASGAIMQSNSFLAQGAKNLLKMGPLFPQYKGPPPPVIPPNQGFLSQFGGGFFKKLGVGRAALAGGAGGAAAFLVFEALKLEVKAVTEALKQMVNAVENARKLYASALSSGAGLKFTTNRVLLSQVLGVSEKDVFQFGRAIQFLSPRLKSATDILSKTTPDLASVSYGFKILELDMQSLFALVVSDLAPTIRKTTVFLSELIHVFESFHKIISGAFKIALDTIITSLPAPLRVLAQTLQAIIGGIKDPGKAPDPLAFMKQIQASSWERMGLVIGGGGSSNPAQETARNTKVTADGVKQLIKIRGGKASFGDPFAGAQSYL